MLTPKFKTREDLRQGAKKGLWYLIAMTAATLLMMTLILLDMNSPWVWGFFLASILFMWGTGGYQSIRIIWDSAYCDKQFVQQNDERLQQIELLTYRRLIGILGGLYFFGGGGVLGFLVGSEASNQVLTAVLAGLLGFALLVYLIYWVTKQVYLRKM